MPHQMTLSMRISFMQIYANEVYIYALLHNIMSMQMDIYIDIYIYAFHNIMSMQMGIYMHFIIL